MTKWLLEHQEFVGALNEWQVLWIPLLVLIISQFVKLLIDLKKGKDVDLTDINAYGGMPSTHTALFVSLSTIVGLTQGFDSPLFAASVLFSAAIIRDAVGIRWALGYHGKVLNHILTSVPEDIRDDFPEKLEERLGHTPKEALAGGTLGVVLTLLFSFLLQLA